jgi:hypothetical protein
MKRTDMERMERELKRIQKKADVLDRKTSKGTGKVNVGTFAKDLLDVLMYDDMAIYNFEDDAVLEVLMELKESLPDKQQEAALKKAVKMTKVKEADSSLEELKLALEAC